MRVVEGEDGGGFSGARVWQVATSDGRYCVRAWPRSLTDSARLHWIHAQLALLASAGDVPVPVPLVTHDQQTWVRWGDRFWEVAPWLPGQADYRSAPHAAKLESALRAAGRLHYAAESGTPAPQMGRSPTLAMRLDMFRRVDENILNRIERELAQPRWSLLALRARRIVDGYRKSAEQAARVVEAVQNEVVPLQVCHGDLWHEHVLFVGDEVSGILDFGAMKFDSPVSDLARLLGSLAGDDAQAWHIGLAAYQQVRPLCASELRLLTAFDVSAVVLSGLNWLTWLILEHRQFERMTRVYERLDEILERLDGLPARLQFRSG